MELQEFSTCFKILEDTIQKKEQLLNTLLELTKAQETVLTGEKFSMEEFTELMDKKEPHIQKIEKLDEGFEAVFKKMKPAVDDYKKEFEPRIKAMQQQIKTVLEKGAALCALEEKNKARLEICLRDRRQEIKSFKKSSQMVSSYYKNMAGSAGDKSLFMDKKK
ncbi:MAG: flagellar export chaperone FlgN [Lachnospiraceae bacterium]|nr:flagellar export chaperone FlgN [Lachnospiraceae bacterium]